MSATADGGTAPIRAEPDGPRTSLRQRAFVLVLCAQAASGIVGGAAPMALPAIRTYFDTSSAAIQWYAALYSLGFALVLILAGRIGDLFGTRRLLLLGYAGFIASINGSALAPTIGVLLFFRALRRGGYRSLVATEDVPAFMSDALPLIVDALRRAGIAPAGPSFARYHAFGTTGLATQAVAWLGAHGVQVSEPGPMLVLGVALSNIVSNVPAVMLMLPHLQGREAGMTLALVSTFAGNLMLVGSIANLIVADLARKGGVTIDWKAHAAIGVPVTLLSLAAVWLAQTFPS